MRLVEQIAWHTNSNVTQFLSLSHFIAFTIIALYAIITDTKWFFFRYRHFFGSINPKQKTTQQQQQPSIVDGSYYSMQ